MTEQHLTPAPTPISCPACGRDDQLVNEQESERVVRYLVQGRDDAGQLVYDTPWVVGEAYLRNGVQCLGCDWSSWGDDWMDLL